jgi:serpin B
MIELMPVSTRCRIATIVFAALTLCAFAAGCGSAATATRTDVAQTPSAGHSGSSPGQATERFGLALMRRLPAGNLAFSPDSVAAALAMVGTGADGPTATQIAHALGLSSPASFASLGDLQQKIVAEQRSASSGGPTLDIANGLFVQRGYSLLAPFTSGLQEFFAAVPEEVDFQSDNGTEAINAWVAEQTHGLIPQIVAELSPETRLALANAIYLNAHWSEHFEFSGDETAAFYGEPSKSSTVFMHKTEPLPYARDRGYTAVSLPYASSTLSLVVVLPHGQTLSALERHFDAGAFDRLMARLTKRNVRVTLPRFHLKYHDILNDLLKALGITSAFSEGADFSKITRVERLKIGEVAHAADFKVDEHGTLASASTVGTAEALSATLYQNLVNFNANHPFMFFLRDDKTGAVLFAGRLVTPQD